MKAIRHLCLALVAVAAPCAQAQDIPLTGEEIRKVLVGKKIFGRSGSNLVEYRMNPDGTSEVSAGTSYQDTGTWRSTDTGYCATWKKLRNGQERCFTVVRRGGSMLVLNPDQSVGTEILRIID